MGIIIFCFSILLTGFFWVLCIFFFLEDIEIVFLMLTIYLSIGFFFATFMTTMDISSNIIVSKRKGIKKFRFRAAYKKQIFKNILGNCLGLILGLIAWLPSLLFIFYDLEQKRKGAPYGCGGGGYIYKERTWRELLGDEFRGREGKP